MEIFVYALLVAVGWFAISKLLEANVKDAHCMTCGSDGKPVSTTKGSLAIELMLWLCFIIPGILYSLWRLTTRSPACSFCKATTLIPMDSPAAKAHKASLVVK